MIPIFLFHSIKSFIQSKKVEGLKYSSFDKEGWETYWTLAGQAHFANLLEQMPDRYKYHEEKELEIASYLKKDVSILRRQRNKMIEPLTLKKFRSEIEIKETNYDLFDFGGCGCFIEESKSEYIA